MRFTLLRFTLLCAPLILANCAQVPELDDHVTPAAKSAPFPALVPLSPLLNDTTDTRITQHTDPALRARAAALRARAQRMRQATNP